MMSDDPEITLYQNLGKMSADYSALEEYLRLAVQALIAEDKVLGKILTAELSFRQLVALLSSLYKYRESNVTRIDKLHNILDEINRLSERRNRMVHSMWDHVGSTKEIFRVKTTSKYKDGLKVKIENVNPAEVNQLANEIVYSTIEIVQFIKEWLSVNPNFISKVK